MAIISHSYSGRSDIDINACHILLFVRIQDVPHDVLGIFTFITTWHPRPGHAWRREIMLEDICNYGIFYAAVFVNSKTAMLEKIKQGNVSVSINNETKEYMIKKGLLTPSL